MVDALQSLWRELVGSWWVLVTLPILLIFKWLLKSTRPAIQSLRTAFFSLSVWETILPAPTDTKDKKTEPISGPEARRRWFLELVESALMALVLVFFIIRPFIVQAFYIPSPSMVETLEINDRILVNKFIYHFHSPNRGDIVVFQPPKRATDNVSDDWIKRVIGVPGDRIAVHNNHLYLNGKVQNEPYVTLLDPETDKTDVANHFVTGQYSYSDFPSASATPPVGKSAYVYMAASGTIQDDNYRVELTNDTTPKPMKSGDEYLWFVHNDPKIGSEIVVPQGCLFVMGDNRNDSADGHLWGYLRENRVLGQAFCIFWPLNRMRMLTNPHTK